VGTTPMTRPSVNINFHHLTDLLGCGPEDVRVILSERFGMSPAVLQAVAHLQRVTLTRNHLVAVGSASGAMLQSYLACAAIASRHSYLDETGALQPAFKPRDAPLLGGFEPWVATHCKAPVAGDGEAIDVVEIPESVDIAVFGDWGTGTPGAERVATSIAASGCPVRVHLGDVYYSGTAVETTSYLIECWPFSGSTLNRACNSNHEMYSGGHSYFRITLPALRQGSSVFALRNKRWLLLGLDTGTVDGRLTQQQVRRLTEIVEMSGSRKVILMSHHPWFSWVEGPNHKLREDVAPLLRTGRVRAWYSAHDHAFVRFDREPEFGLHLVCAGHGGFPYTNVPADRDTIYTSGGFTLQSLSTTGDLLGGQVLHGPSLGEPSEEYGPLGWVRLTLDGPNLVEHVMDQDGQAHFPWSAIATS
jgi:hypothetical protein